MRMMRMMMRKGRCENDMRQIEKERERERERERGDLKDY
jgi:hypothetical protein